MENKEYKNDKTRVIYKDILNLNKSDLSELDAVVNAFGDFTSIANKAFLETTNHLCDLLDGNKTRLLVVGGAGSLYADETRS